MIYMTTVVIWRGCHAQDPIEGCQGELVGGGGSGHPRQAFAHYPAWQAGSGCARLRRMGAAVSRPVVRPPSDVGTACAGGFAGAQPRADTRRRPVTRYLVDTNVISAAAP